MVTTAFVPKYRGKSIHQSFTKSSRSVSSPDLTIFQNNTVAQKIKEKSHTNPTTNMQAPTKTPLISQRVSAKKTLACLSESLPTNLKHSHPLPHPQSLANPSRLTGDRPKRCLSIPLVNPTDQFFFFLLFASDLAPLTGHGICRLVTLVTNWDKNRNIYATRLSPSVPRCSKGILLVESKGPCPCTCTCIMHVKLLRLAGRQGIGFAQLALACIILVLISRTRRLKRSKQNQL